MKPFSRETTIGNKYGPAMEITGQKEADAYFELCVAHTMSLGATRVQAESIERANLGYYAGYYSDATRSRVERLFHCEHPIFGKITEKGPPSLQGAFTKGYDIGSKSDRRTKT